jgi:diguanylate cyclase (GGDEF)-like protein
MSIDMDKLKELNDTKGHAAGDEAIKLVGNVIKNSTRQHVDSAYRIGGDEFIVILPISDTKLTLMIAERIRSNYFSQTNGETTLSIGVTKFIKTSDINTKVIDEMVKKADTAMYASKKHGGNTVVVDVKDNGF